MPNRKIILFVLLVLGTYVSRAQTYGEQPSIAGPSVNEKFNINDNNSVDLYRGRNEVNIPIYSIEIGENKLDIGLTYTAGNGLKVKDVAGYYGMGWSLKAGGSVSRYVMGIPDEEPKGYCGTERFGTTLNGFNENTLTIEMLNKIGKDGYDGEPDLFMVCTPFFSFQFVLDQNGNVVFPNPNGFKVIHNLNNNSNHTNTNFEIIDNVGNRFIFGTTSASRETITTKLGTTNKTFITSWFLNQIIWFNEKEKINFTYAAASNYTTTNSVYAKATFATSPTCSISDNPETKVDYPTTVNSPKYLKQIESTNARVDFVYEFNREDIGTMPKLSMLKISSLKNSVPMLLHSFSLKYTYVGATIPSNKRLYLLSVEKLNGSVWLELFSFNYHNVYPLPSVTSKEFDYWGYYNINTTGSATVPTANKQPNINRTLSGALKSVKYVTGKQHVFSYEANSYYNTATSSNVTGPGIRLSRISILNESNQEVNYTDFIYEESNGNSTGEIQSENYKQFTKQINVLAIGSSGYCGVVGTSTSSTASFSDENVNDLRVGYSKVIKKAKDNSKEEYYYTNYSQFPDVFINRISDNTNYSFESSRQLNMATSRSFKRGVLTKKAVYSTSQMISESIYEYSDLGNTEIKSCISIKLAPKMIVLGANVTVWLYGVSFTLKDVYRLSREKNREYSKFNASEMVETIVDYTYAANNRQVRKVTTHDSRGESTESITYYTADATLLAANPLFSSSNITVMNELMTKNVVDNPVYSKNIKGSFISETAVYFEKIYSGTINKYFPTKVSRNLNGTHIKDVLTSYDNTSSNLVSVNEKDNVITSYIWNYNGKYPVAKVINATNSGIAYSSFEADNKGNWIYTDPGHPQSVGAVTGQRFLNINSSSPQTVSKENLEPGKRYIISYWSKQNIPFSIIGGTDSYELGRNVSGWFFHKHIVNATSSTISVIVNAAIDELRLHPVNAQMTTYTYDPLVGITSECDINNRITYYEYDEFGMLNLVRDQDKNITRKICYNYAGQEESCQIFGNLPRARSFRKNDCTGCKIGSEVGYTVPADAYFATSQTAADALAQSEIDTYGPAYANANGTCTAPVMTNINGYNGISGKRFTLLLHNNCTGTNYYIYLDPGVSGVNLNPQIPTGNYNVTITPDGGSGPYSYSFASFYQYANTASFLGVDITTTKRYLAIQP